MSTKRTITRKHAFNADKTPDLIRVLPVGAAHRFPLEDAKRASLYRRLWASVNTVESKGLGIFSLYWYGSGYAVERVA